MFPPGVGEDGIRAILGILDELQLPCRRVDEPHFDTLPVFRCGVLGSGRAIDKKAGTNHVVYHVVRQLFGGSNLLTKTDKIRKKASSDDKKKVST